MLLFLLILIGPPILFVVARNAMGPSNNAALATKVVFILYLLLALLYLLTIIASKFNYYIKGYRSTSVLFISIGVTATIYWILDRQSVFNGFLRAISFFVSMIAISFSSVLLAELLGDYKHQLIYSDSDYRLEETGRTIMNPCKLPALFVKNSFYEREFAPTIDSYCFAKSDILSIKIIPLSRSEISVTYLLIDRYASSFPNPLTMNYRMK